MLASDDLSSLFLPAGYELATAIAQGRLPLWTTNLQFGFPLFAEGHIAAFYLPDVLLYWVLPPTTALSFAILLHLGWHRLECIFSPGRADAALPVLCWQWRRINHAELCLAVLGQAFLDLALFAQPFLSTLDAVAASSDLTSPPQSVRAMDDTGPVANRAGQRSTQKSSADDALLFRLARPSSPD